MAIQARRLLGTAIGQIGSRPFFNDVANAPEAYADRMKKDLHLNDYADAWALYSSDPAYWNEYYGKRPQEPDWRSTAVRDSAAGAGVPSRNNVFEYGFPQTYPAQTSSAGAATSSGYGQAVPAANRSAAGDHLAGAVSAPTAVSPSVSKAPPFPQRSVDPILYLPSAQQNAPRGLPGMMIDAGYVDPTNLDPPQAGGLAGLLQDYLRNNAGINR